MTNRTHPASDEELLSRDLDGLLLHLRGLILVRQLLAQRGATQTELDTHSGQIHQLRERPADAFRDPLADDSPSSAANAGPDHQASPQQPGSHTCPIQTRRAA